MTHWLEEAEREEQRKKQRPADESARIQDKKFRIAKNYDANKAAYDDFIEILFDLCERANNLPLEKRLPWHQIEFKTKETRYQNHLVSVSTSEGLDKTILVNTFPFVKSQHYKHMHKMYISVSKEMGKAEIEIKNDYLAKTRLRTDEKEVEPLLDDGLPRLKVLFLYDIDKLDKDLAFKILDWLAFKIDVKSLPFEEEHIKFKGEKR
ncbi:MAG: hypothetical protein ACLFPE_10615 [Bacteroidales bacterium]